ncbi:MAG: phage tail protein [Spirulinaceae cyanobacterium]
MILPTGTLISFAGTEPPSGYLAADGSAVSRSTYANLYSVIGTTYGEGDGSTTFNLPDFRGRFIRGLAPGRNLNDYQASQNKSHSHTFNVVSGGGNSPSPANALLAQDVIVGAQPYATGSTADTTMKLEAIEPQGGDQVVVENLPALICIKF